MTGVGSAGVEAATTDHFYLHHHQQQQQQQQQQQHNHQSHRDPGGLNPKGMQLEMGEDPPIGFNESAAANDATPASAVTGETFPATPAWRAQSKGLPASAASSPSMAVLVGMPPPPPPNDPPPKRKRSKSTPRISHHQQQEQEQPTPRDLHASEPRRQRPFSQGYGDEPTDPTITTISIPSPRKNNNSNAPSPMGWNERNNDDNTTATTPYSGSRSRSTGSQASPHELPSTGATPHSRMTEHAVFLDDRFVAATPRSTTQDQPSQRSSDPPEESHVQVGLRLDAAPTPRDVVYAEEKEMESSSPMMRNIAVLVNNGRHHHQQPASSAFMQSSPMSAATAPVSHVQHHHGHSAGGQGHSSSIMEMGHDDLRAQSFATTSPVRSRRLSGGQGVALGRPRTPERLRRVLGTVPRLTATSKSPERRRSRTPEQQRRRGLIGRGQPVSPGQPPQRRAKTPDGRKTMRPKTPDGRQRSTSQSMLQRPKTPDGRQLSSSDRSRYCADGPSRAVSATAATTSKQKKGFFGRLFGGKKKSSTFSESSSVIHEVPYEDQQTVPGYHVMTLTTREGYSTETEEPERLVRRQADLQQDESHEEELDSKEVTPPRWNNQMSRFDAGVPAASMYSINASSGREAYNGPLSVTGGESASEDRTKLFFEPDEISTLTAPTLDSHYRKDPVERSSRVNEPVGHYWNAWNPISHAKEEDGFPSIDPFTEPFFQEPAGASPMPPTSQAIGSSLRIDVPTVHDPIGESPVNKVKTAIAPSPARADHVLIDPSPRGIVTRMSTSQKTVENPLNDPSPQGFQKTPMFVEKFAHQDPIGESPLHKLERGPSAVLDGTPYAPDPPLYLVELEELDDSTSRSASSEEDEPATEEEEPTKNEFPHFHQEEEKQKQSLVATLSEPAPIELEINEFATPPPPPPPPPPSQSPPASPKTRRSLSPSKRGAKRRVSPAKNSTKNDAALVVNTQDKFPPPRLSLDPDTALLKSWRETKGQSPSPSKQRKTTEDFEQSGDLATRGKDPSESGAVERKALPATPAKGRDAEEQAPFKKFEQPISSPARGKDAVEEGQLERFEGLAPTPAAANRRSRKGDDLLPTGAPGASNCSPSKGMEALELRNADRISSGKNNLSVSSTTSQSSHSLPPAQGNPSDLQSSLPSPSNLPKLASPEKVVLPILNRRRASEVEDNRNLSPRNVSREPSITRPWKANPSPRPNEGHGHQNSLKYSDKSVDEEAKAVPSARPIVTAREPVVLPILSRAKLPKDNKNSMPSPKYKTSSESLDLPVSTQHRNRSSPTSPKKLSSHLTNTMTMADAKASTHLIRSSPASPNKSAASQHSQPSNASGQPKSTLTAAECSTSKSFVHLPKSSKDAKTPVSPVNGQVSEKEVAAAIQKNSNPSVVLSVRSRPSMISPFAKKADTSLDKKLQIVSKSSPDTSQPDKYHVPGETTARTSISSPALSLYSKQTGCSGQGSLVGKGRDAGERVVLPLLSRRSLKNVTPSEVNGDSTESRASEALGPIHNPDKVPSKQPAKSAAAWMKNVFSPAGEQKNQNARKQAGKNARTRWHFTGTNNKECVETNIANQAANDKTLTPQESLVSKRRSQLLARATSTRTSAISVQAGNAKGQAAIIQKPRKQLPDPPADRILKPILEESFSMQCTAQQYSGCLDRRMNGVSGSSGEQTEISEESELERLHESHSLETKSPSTQKMQSLQLTIASAAQMNAKTIAYLHALDGAPSPRHAWRGGDLSDDDASPQHSKKARNGEKSLSSKPRNCLEIGLTTFPVSNAKADDDSNVNDISRLFAAYSTKFKGRKPSQPSPRRLLVSTRKEPEPRAQTQSQQVIQLRKYRPAVLDRDVSISRQAVKMGFNLLREQRENDILTGNVIKVVPVWKPKKTNIKESAKESEPLDPIQRAGRRLLAKAAIPVQAAARRYLAQKEAVDRMWALLEIQSYFRRWRAEAAFIASRVAGIQIQSVLRGALCRSKLYAQQHSATQIQRIFRGYMCAIRVYDAVYRIILVQAKVRGNIARDNHFLHLVSAVAIQAAMRGFLTRKVIYYQLQCICKIQAAWRSYYIRTCFQFVVVDIIIAQSVARRWICMRQVSRLRNEIRSDAAVMIQAAWRSHMLYSDYRRNKSATLIQSIWRGVTAYIAYKQRCNATTIQKVWRCFVVQTSFMQFKAARKIQAQYRCWKLRNQYRQYKAATNIQAIWRGLIACASYKQNRGAVRIQALWRCSVEHAKYRQYRAATKIQAAWRGFIAFCNYSRERAATKIQALWRGLTLQSRYQQFIAARKIQAIWRGLIVFTNFRRQRAVCIIQTKWIAHWAFKRNASATKIQSIWRGLVTYSLYRQYMAATRIQAIWRAAQARSTYRRNIAATMIQTRWRSVVQHAIYTQCKAAATSIQAAWRGFRIYRSYGRNRCASKIQLAWKCHRVAALETNNKAAATIQAAWRCFQCYTDYIFTLVDVLTVQRTARKWLARRRTMILRRRLAALKIQTQWRRKHAQLQLLYDLVHIIMVQVRRQLASLSI